MDWNSYTLSYSSSVLWIALIKVTRLLLKNILSLTILHMSHQIIDQISLIFIIHNLPEQSTWLGEIRIWMSKRMSTNRSRSSKRLLPCTRVLLRCSLNSIRLIIRFRSLISINTHLSISLIVSQSSHIRAVDRNLVEIRTKSMSVGVHIRKKPSLKHFVIRRLYSRHHIGRTKS